MADMVPRHNFGTHHAKAVKDAMNIAKDNAEAFAQHNSWSGAIDVGSIEQEDIEEEKEMQKLKNIFGIYGMTGNNNREEICRINKVLELLKKKFTNRETLLENYQQSIRNLQAQFAQIDNFLKSEIPLPKKVDENVNTLTVHYEKANVQRFGLKIALVDQKFVITEVKGYSSRIVGIVPGLILHEVIIDSKQVKEKTPADLAAKMTSGLKSDNGFVKLCFAAVKKSSASAFKSTCYKSN